MQLCAHDTKSLLCRRAATGAARRPVTPVLQRLAAALGMPVVQALVTGLSVDAAIQTGGEDAAQHAAGLAKQSQEPRSSPAVDVNAALETPDGGEKCADDVQRAHETVVASLRKHVAEAAAGVRHCMQMFLATNSCERSSAQLLAHAV